MAKKKKGIKPIAGMPILGIDEDGNLNIDINAEKRYIINKIRVQSRLKVLKRGQ